MALADKTAAGKRIMELYKDDAEMCTDLLSSLLNLDAAKFSEFRDMWVITLGSPVEKLFLEKNLPGVVAGLGSMVPAAGGGSSSRRPALQKVQLFWQALLALPSIIVGSFLTLPSNVYLLGTKSLGSSLLVRHCYRGIFDRMMELRSSNGMSRFLITGTPGIGKSFFAVVLMGWLVQEKGVSTIILDFDGLKYLFTTNGTDIKVEMGSEMDFIEEVNDPKTWWIVDTGTAFRRPASTVLLASPDRQRYKEFLKFQGTTTLFMPIWTDDEIKECRIRLYPHLSDATVRDLVWKWGNIPRYVLEKAMETPAQNSLKEALEQCEWQDVINCIVAPDSAPHTSHKLVHFEVVGNHYDQKVMKPASPYVMEEMERKAGTDHIRQLQSLIHLSMGKPALAATAGLFFERYAHRRLQEGGSFQVRQLGAPKTAHSSEDKVIPFELQCAGVHKLYKLEEVRQQVNEIYCVPPSHNFPAVDSIMQPEFLFQITTTQKSKVPLDGLLAAARQLHGTPKLCFVVPSQIFKEYKFVNGIPEDMEQWVLEVPYL
ncbi:hypothetical protein Vafri_15463 [Volvox africanus]|uniref:Uncharacterized protein n=1 Tax=Volvox africanus TaxID=51714 RepID=A0A8J4F4S1_9CHLO|nr:hypothetical protein Vafri_15463 [Volvox africanus]